MYEYQCRVIRVVDGDSLKVEVDLGFDVRAWIDLRIDGVNAPEARGPEREIGKLAREWLSRVLVSSGDVDTPLELHSFGRDKYGRWLGDVIIPTVLIDSCGLQPAHLGLNGYSKSGRVVVGLHEWILETGIGVPWDGSGPRPSFSGVTELEYASGFFHDAQWLLRDTAKGVEAGQRNFCEDVAQSVAGRA